MAYKVITTNHNAGVRKNMLDLKLIRERAKHIYESTNDSITRIAMKLSLEFNIAEGTAKDIILHRNAYFDSKPGLKPRYSIRTGRPRRDKELDYNKIKRTYDYFRKTHPSESHTRTCTRVALKLNCDRSTVKRYL